MKRIFTGTMIFLLAGAAFAAGSQEGDAQTVVFADNNYESIQVHNRIAAFILENGYGGISADYIPGDTIPLVNGLAAGDIDVYMESWHENFQEVYDEFTNSGDIVNIGANMPPAPQGWYVPRYMVEGDPERGIEPVAPNLTSISDLPEYWELFRDPENPDRGRIIVGPPGWKATEMSQEMMEENGLYETYTDVLPGSGTALVASMTSAYERGNPWVGYHWEPTAIIGRLDMVMLEGSEFPPTSVDILVNGEFAESNPEIIAFLEEYGTSLAQNNDMLAQMEDEGLDFQETAEYFLREYEDAWTEWVSQDVANRVRAALQ
ncbi:MAG: glycine betaine ABC transporter substrate-binding protein [Alkalispirochaeta sp.]